MESKNFNVIESSFLVVIVTITHLILNLPHELIQNQGSSVLVNIIYVSILALLLFFLIRKLLSPFEGNNILYVAEYVGGSYLRSTLSYLYIFHFILTSGILLRSFAETLIIVYYPNASLISIIMLFILVALIVNQMGAINVVRANSIIMVPVLSAIVITAISLLGKIEFNRLFPLMGYGFKNTFISGISNIYAYSGLVYIYLIKSKLKNSKDFTKVGLISIIISSIYLILTIAALLMIFPFLTSGGQAYTVYLSTRIIEYGKFMQRTDAIYMFVWIFTFISYLSVIILCINQIGRESFKYGQNFLYKYIVVVLISLVAIIPNNTTILRFMETIFYKYLTLVIVFILSLFILILGYIKKKRRESI